jgi:hypothetical protein
MNPTIKFDDSVFQDVFRKYLTVCKREISEIVNKKMLIIISGAYNRTVKADAAKIESYLGIGGYAIRTGKKGQFLHSKGKLRRGNAFFNAKRIHLIVNSYRGKAKMPGLYGAEMAAESQEFIRRKIGARGTLRRGWVKALQLLIKFVKDKSGSMFYKGYVKTPSRVSIAKEGWSPVCEVEYRLNIGRSKTKSGIDPRVVGALRESMNAEAQSMGEYISRKLNQIDNPLVQK